MAKTKMTYYNTETLADILKTLIWEADPTLLYEPDFINYILGENNSNGVSVICGLLYDDSPKERILQYKQEYDTSITTTYTVGTLYKRKKYEPILYFLVTEVHKDKLLGYLLNDKNYTIEYELEYKNNITPYWEKVDSEDALIIVESITKSLIDKESRRFNEVRDKTDKVRSFIKPNETTYRGVYKKVLKYEACITINNKKHREFGFSNPEDAARWYDSMIIKNGLDRPLNFPEDYIHEAL